MKAFVLLRPLFLNKGMQLDTFDSFAHLVVMFVFQVQKE